MNREKVEFPANIPTVVELDGIGALQASKSGDDEYRYFLKENRIMWVPPAVHEQIEAAQGNTGDVFEITKHQTKARAPINWEARLQQTERDIHNGYSNQPAPPAPAADNWDRQPGQGWTRREAPQPQPAPQRQPTSQAQAPPPLRSQPRPPQPAVGLAADAPELPITAADRMAAALRDAIDLYRGACQYAPELKWDAGDVRALAATLFIEQSKNGGRL